MENKRISITTYSVEKITVNVRKVRLKPIEANDEAADPEPSIELPMPEASSTEFEAGKDKVDETEEK